MSSLVLALLSLLLLVIEYGGGVEMFIFQTLTIQTGKQNFQRGAKPKFFDERGEVELQILLA